MALLAILDGIRLCVYANDHNPPHIHAEFAEYRALFLIVGATLDKGSLPKTKIKIVEDFIKENEFLIMKAWHDTQNKKLVRRLK
jgi:hypothetical protein